MLQGDCRCERVAGNVIRNSVFYSGEFGYFFEITVHDLIADIRE